MGDARSLREDAVDPDYPVSAETAHQARRQPRVPLLVGSNSTDTAGNRIRATESGKRSDF